MIKIWLAKQGAKIVSSKGGRGFKVMEGEGAPTVRYDPPHKTHSKYRHAHNKSGAKIATGIRALIISAQAAPLETLAEENGNLLEEVTNGLYMQKSTLIETVKY